MYIKSLFILFFLLSTFSISLADANPNKDIKKNDYYNKQKLPDWFIISNGIKNLSIKNTGNIYNTSFIYGSQLASYFAIEVVYNNNSSSLGSIQDIFMLALLNKKSDLTKSFDYSPYIGVGGGVSFFLLDFSSFFGGSIIANTGISFNIKEFLIGLDVKYSYSTYKDGLNYQSLIYSVNFGLLF